MHLCICRICGAKHCQFEEAEHIRAVVQARTADLEVQLAAALGREKVYREALKHIADHDFDDCCGTDEKTRCAINTPKCLVSAEVEAIKALAQKPEGE